MSKSLRTVVAAAVGLLASAAWSADYQFDVVYSGNGISDLVPGSQDPRTVTLQPGDSFIWTISALADKQWTVLVGGDVFPMMALGIAEKADRRGDFQFDLLNDGLPVLSLTETDSFQSQVHMGTNTIALPTGLVFDRWELHYTLRSAIEITSVDDPDNPGSLIDVRGGPTGSSPTGLLPIFGIVDDTKSGNASTTVFAAVPEPASWALWLLGVAAVGAATRRRCGQPH